jgi:hypothetical protein
LLFGRFGSECFAMKSMMRQPEQGERPRAVLIH